MKLDCPQFDFQLKIRSFHICSARDENDAKSHEPNIILMLDTIFCEQNSILHKNWKRSWFFCLHFSELHKLSLFFLKFHIELMFIPSAWFEIFTCDQPVAVIESFKLLKVITLFRIKLFYSVILSTFESEREINDYLKND